LSLTFLWTELFSFQAMTLRLHSLGH
jgi:hypothetical protein